ncbi:hypothetical protein B649_08400 [Candidatus Sulfuricurvum sp. RIFRC-1]|uniref:hypothetical protein n=1 Tax=Candidatus Sulfuricurvum sp. RIFRC-1 TaxID=1249480 RepID=UPI0002997AE4|nr:hypothetical protein [Candidatus Sulfuricurvum sp. RIFRC-1]AFV97992.1 hypothetical protein B649_08400 [Candidatus Sulfuricurvum sp. RIFRC-1]
MIRKQPVAISIVCSIALTVWADPIPVSLDQNNLRMTYETLAMPGNESMGLIGLNYQQMFGSYWYGGLGIYGAAAGERGGFFTGGFEGGLRYPLIGGLEAEGGVFIGGGGGGAAHQGGGLMLRPHVGVTYGNSDIRAGLQLSRIEFPNGEIRSTQIAGVVDIPFESFRLDGGYGGSLDSLPYDVAGIFQRSLELKEGAFGVEIQHYTQISDSLKTDGTLLIEPFETVGIRYTNFLSRNVAWYITTAGAMGGGADGYAEIFAGMGWRYGVLDNIKTKSRVFLNLEGAVGMGGGGEVATGGGAMGKVSAGLSYQLSPEWSLDARSGYTQAVDGDFKARTLIFSLNHTLVTLSPSKGMSVGNINGETLIRRVWRVRPLHETYISAQRKSADAEEISLVGMQIDALSSGAGYLYARALGAYSGGAGGYASGTLGLGVNYPLPLQIPLELYVQAGVGAGGGGGIDVGTGAIVEVETGVLYKIAPNTDAILGVGTTRSLSDGLETPTLQLGLSYRFGTFGSRHTSY